MINIGSIKGKVITTEYKELGILCARLSVCFTFNLYLEQIMTKKEGTHWVWYRYVWDAATAARAGCVCYTC